MRPKLIIVKLLSIFNSLGVKKKQKTAMHTNLYITLHLINN